MFVPKAAVAVYARLDVAWAVHREMILMAIAMKRVGVIATGRTLYPEAGRRLWLLRLIPFAVTLIRKARLRLGLLRLRLECVPRPLHEREHSTAACEFILPADTEY